MPRNFSDEEMKIIKEDLLINGKELFIKFGYKKFGIRELTAKVGISNGMFYKFFASKEELYFTILDSEKRKVRKRIHEEVIKYIDEPIRALKVFYNTVIDELLENPMMRTLLLKDEYGFVARKMTKEQLLEERIKSLDPILEITEYWKQKGLVKNANMDLVIGSLRSLVLLWFHKSEIGEDEYQNIIDFMIERICDYVKG